MKKGQKRKREKVEDFKVRLFLVFFLISSFLFSLISVFVIVSLSPRPNLFRNGRRKSAKSWLLRTMQLEQISSSNVCLLLR